MDPVTGSQGVQGGDGNVQINLFTGEQHVRVHNLALARALAQAAATGR